MGIPVGKCFLHSAGGGLAPSQCLPVLVDAGCASESGREDRFYLGRRAPRLRGAAYDAILAEALQALRGRFGPKFIVHLEDVAGSDAAALLARPAANSAESSPELARLLGGDSDELALPLLAFEELELWREKDEDEPTRGGVERSDGE